MKVGFIGPSTGISIQQLIKVRTVLPKLKPNLFVFVKQSGKANNELTALSNQVLRHKTAIKTCDYNQLINQCDVVISMTTGEKPGKTIGLCWDIVKRAKENNKQIIIIFPNGKDSVF